MLTRGEGGAPPPLVWQKTILFSNSFFEPFPLLGACGEGRRACNEPILEGSIMFTLKMGRNHIEQILEGLTIFTLIFLQVWCLVDLLSKVHGELIFLDYL